MWESKIMVLAPGEELLCCTIVWRRASLVETNRTSLLLGSLFLLL
jgi:hypothetical protein